MPQTVNGKIKKVDLGKMVWRLGYCIHSDFCRLSNNGLNFEAGNHVKNLGFVFEILYKEYIRIGGNEEAWERMTTQNTIDVLDI